MLSKAGWTRIFSRNSLFTRFFLLCLASATLGSLLAVAGFYQYRSVNASNRMAVELANTAHISAPLLEAALADNQHAEARRILRLFAAFHYVQCVDILDDGALALSWPAIGCAKLPIVGETMTFDQSFSQSGRVLTLRIDESISARNLYMETALFAATIFIIILLIFCALALSFRNVVLRPLDLLKSAMIVASPENPVLAKRVRNDELGAMVDVYNKLAASSRYYMRRLQRYQDSLVTSEQRFKDLAEISGDWFYEMDENLNFAFISERFFDLFALRDEDVIGKSHIDLNAGEAENEMLRQHTKLMKRHEEFRNLEYQLIDGGGNVKWVSINGKPVFDEAAVFTGYRGTGSDITVQKLRARLLEETSRDINDSLQYASNIQRALLCDRKHMTAILGKTIAIWQPKDLVGGDFYWLKKIGNQDYLVFFDCTGHGVPGAFMTLIVTSVLDQIAVSTSSALSGTKLMYKLHESVCAALGLSSDKTAGKDGLDCAVLCFSKNHDRLEFCGASMDLYLVPEEGAATRLRGDKAMLGYDVNAKLPDFKTYDIDIDTNSFVIATDGFITQVGSAENRVFGSRRFAEALDHVQGNDPSKLARFLAKTLKDWQGSEERRDDVTVLAFKPSQKD